MLHLTYWWLFILLHRPFFHRRAKLIHSTDKEIDHVKVCIPLLCSIELITVIVLLSSASAPQKISWSCSRLGVPSTHCDTHQSLSYRPSFQLEQYTSCGASKQPPDPAWRTKSSRLLWTSRSSATSTSSRLENHGSALRTLRGILKNLMQEQLKPVLERRQLVPRLVEDEGIIPPAIQRSSSATSRKRTTAAPPRKGKQRKSSKGRGQALDTVLPPLDATPNISCFTGPHSSTQLILRFPDSSFDLLIFDLIILLSPYPNISARPLRPLRSSLPLSKLRPPHPPSPPLHSNIWMHGTTEIH
jgi:hypothetical protein